MNRLLCSRRVWKSWVLTGILCLIFMVFLKQDIRNTLIFFDLPTFFSQDSWNVIVIAFALAPVFLYMRYIGLDLFGGLVMGLFFITFLSTMYNKGNLSSWALDLFPCLASAWLVAALCKEYSRNLLQGLFIASSIYLLCNLIYIFRDLEVIAFGATDYLFYGYRNATFHIAIPAFACSVLLDNMDGKKCTLRSVTVYALAMFELLVGYSATSTFAFVVFGGLVLLVQFEKFRPLVNGATIGIAYVLMFIGVVVLRLQDKFSFLIEMMGRSLTFTDRTLIWDEAIKLLNDPAVLTGYGKSYELIVNKAVFYAHNDVLHILLMAGVGGLLILVAIVAMADRGLFICRREVAAAYLSSALFALALIGLFESVLCPAAAFLVAFAYYRTKNTSRRGNSHSLL